MCGYASVGCPRTKLIRLDVRINGSCLADAECFGNTILLRNFQCFFVLLFCHMIIQKSYYQTDPKLLKNTVLYMYITF